MHLNTAVLVCVVCLLIFAVLWVIFWPAFALRKAEDRETKSLDLLVASGFYIHSGIIQGPAAHRCFMPWEWEAIDYLCKEWDYEFVPTACVRSK